MGSITRRLARVVVVLGCVAGACGLVVRAQHAQVAGSWATTGAIPQARTDAASVTLHDGRTLIAGGRQADGSVTASVIALDPSANLVVSVGQLVAPRIGHTATLLQDGRVLIVGGIVGDGISADVEMLDPVSGVSTLVGALSQSRTEHAATALADGKVLIVGGTTMDAVASAGAELFDPQTTTGSVIPGVLAIGRRGASATTLVDRRVLVVGGNDGHQDLASAEVFEPWSGTFAALDPESHLSVPRSGHTALLLPHNNSVLIAGGQSNGTPVAAADLYVPAEFPDPYSYGVGHFAPTAAMNAARWRATSGPAGDNGYAFVVGGGTAVAEVYRYATLKTDKDDYAPGERATITGSGWQPGEDVMLVFQEDPAVHDDYRLHVTADAEGNIYWDQWAPEWHDLNVRFYLSAHDSKSRAQITFTDAMPASVTLTPPSASVAAGSTASYDVTTVKGGNSATCTVTLNFAYSGTPPVGTVPSFGLPNPFDLTTSNVTRTLTITTTNSGAPAGRTQPGAYPFTVSATRAANCQGNSPVPPTATGTLVVTGTTAATSLSAAAGAGTYGGAVTLSATLASGGAGVSGKTIDFTVNGGAAGSATTDASGVATLNGVSLGAINAGSYATGVNASFAGDVSFLGSTGSNTLTVAEATATVALANLVQTYDGSPRTVTATTTPAGLTGVTITYGGSTTAPTNAGAYDVIASLSHANYQAESATGTLVVSKADQVIAWTAPAAITYNTALSGAQLNASLTSGDGALTYTPAAGTILNAGSHTLRVDAAATANYNAAFAEVALTVNKADQVIAWTAPVAITYNTALSGAQLNASLTSGDGALTYTPAAGTILNAGSHTLRVDAAATANYNAAFAEVAVTVNKADQVIAWSAPAAITYNTALSGAQLNASLTSGDGALTYTPAAGTILNAGSHTLRVDAAATANYNAAFAEVALTVNKADQVIAWTPPAAITYNTALSGAQLNASLTSGDGALTYTPAAGTILNAGSHTLRVDAAATANYNAAFAEVALTVNKADQVIAWTPPAAITYNTALSGAQLNASLTSGDGALTYTPAAGTILNAGSHTLRVDAAATANYNAAFAEVALTVNKADQIIAWTPPAAITYNTALSGAQLNASLTSGDGALTYTPAAGTILNAGSHTLRVDAAATANYNAAFAEVALTVNKADQIIAWNAPTAIEFGTELSAVQLNATLTSGDGALTYSPAAGTVLLAGANLLQVSAAETANYKPATKSVTLVVNPWRVTGFYNPVTMGGPAVVNTVKGGSTVPLKFNLYTGGGAELTSTGDVVSFQVYPMSCSAGTTEDPVDLTTTGGTSLRYDFTARQFIQNWQTPRAAGACYQVTMNTRDGSAISAFFKTK